MEVEKTGSIRNITLAYISQYSILKKGDFNITETLVIIHYLCEKFKSKLLGETAQDKAIVMTLAHISHQVKIENTTLCFTQNEASIVLDKVW